jgi:hypothetical protein
MPASDAMRRMEASVEAGDTGGRSGWVTYGLVRVHVNVCFVYASVSGSVATMVRR